MEGILSQPELAVVNKSGLGVILTLMPTFHKLARDLVIVDMVGEARSDLRPCTVVAVKKEDE